jgi:hypothetical protein
MTWSSGGTAFSSVGRSVHEDQPSVRRASDSETEKDFMRKKLTVVAASIAVAVGLGFGLASSASAKIHGVYESEAECREALEQTGRTDLFCGWTPGDDGRGVWVLDDGQGGG